MPANYVFPAVAHEILESEGSAEHREVLGEDAHGSTVDGAVSGDHTVAVGAFLLQAEVVGAMSRKPVELLEGALVEESLDALHCGELALGVLLVDGSLSATSGFGAPPQQFIGLVRRGLRGAGGGGSGHARTLAG